MEIKNTKDLMDPDKLKLKVLVYSLAGTGKSDWASDSLDPGIVACETGQGSGLQTIAQKGLDYVEPRTIADFEAVCRGQIFADKQTIVLDSLTEMNKTFIKDAALAIPRARGNSAKRQSGVPELDDYGTMAEITRRLLRRLLELDKHIVVTATLKVDMPDMETGKGSMTIGPDLPGQLFRGCPAMFDAVFCMKTRSLLRDPKDAKTRYSERYFVTQPTNVIIAKSRFSANGTPFLAPEVTVDPKTGAGSFTEILAQIKAGYAKLL